MRFSDQEIANAANYPGIRLFTVGQATVSTSPLLVFATIEQPWSVASAASVGNGPWSFFSATCWYYGRSMYDYLKVPVGLVSSNWGGTYVQAWSSPDALKQCPNSKRAVENIADGPNPNQPSVLWNAMIVPLLPMRVKAITWYQAEANVGTVSDVKYVCQFPAMIADWRAKLNSKDLHFYYVQLAPYWTDDHTSLAGMRLAQEAALVLPYAGMATAVDLGDANSTSGVIHPRDKLTVGLRLARAALSMSYNQPISWLGPYATKAVYALLLARIVSFLTFPLLSLDTANSRIVITFKLQTQFGDSLTVVPTPSCPKAPFCSGFEYLPAGSSKWESVTATAAILDQSGVISIPYDSSKATPASVRYLFADWPLCTVYSTSNLPALPFLLTVSRQ